VAKGVQNMKRSYIQTEGPREKTKGDEKSASLNSGTTAREVLFIQRDEN